MVEAKSSGNDLKTARDTLESIWVAIVLAFVLRAFVIEAFVIPTGSMAPRLMGEHFDLQCPACGYDFAFGKQGSLSGAHCPNCGFGFSALDKTPPVNGGDRVLVLKYLYQFQPPQRWDVVVFVNPQDNRINFIKRLIGLPGERVEIVHGDIFVSRKIDKDHWSVPEIQRKPHRAQEAMWQVVFNNDYQPNRGKAPGTDASPDAPKWEVQGGWTVGDFGRTFDFAGDKGELSFDGDRELFLPRYGYNTMEAENHYINRNTDICTDLKLAMVFAPRSPDARVAMELTSFDNRFRAEISADGGCTLVSTTAKGTFTQSAILSRPLQPGKEYQAALTHADLEATLWIDDQPILRTTSKQYDVTYDQLKKLMHSSRPVPRPDVKIEGLGGKFQVRHVQLSRDVYYTCNPVCPLKDRAYGDFARAQGVPVTERTPGWGTTDHGIELAGGGKEESDLDQFFVLGDNSPLSLDGRAWTDAAPTLRLWDDKGKPIYQLGTVPRYSMKGKAMFVYWPAGFRAFGWAILPNVGRMRLIR